jgi:hypothetical protein
MKLKSGGWHGLANLKKAPTWTLVTLGYSFQASGSQTMFMAILTICLMWDLFVEGLFLEDKVMLGSTVRGIEHGILGNLQL